jgi:hypothetical protein
VHHTCGALRTMRSMQRTPHIVRRLVLGVQRAACNTQHATRSVQRTACYPPYPNSSDAVTNTAPKRPTMQRATSQCNMNHPTGRQDRSHTTRNMQTATLNATLFARHATSKRARTVHRERCNKHDATNITHHATYNAPHATYSCSTHNCQQRGSRTAVEFAMLPPLKRTDPPYIITTPPSCTPPPRSAAADPIGLPMPRVPLGLRCRRSPQTRT